MTHKRKSDKRILQWCPRRKKLVYKHRLLVERHLGKELTRKHRVYFINGDVSDCRLANLICVLSGKVIFDGSEI